MMRIVVFVVALVGWVHIVDAQKPPIFISAKVINYAVQGSSTVMTTVKGTEEGVTRYWTAKVVVDGREVADAKIIRVDKSRTLVSAEIHFGKAPNDLVVRFTPPAAKN